MKSMIYHLQYDYREQGGNHIIMETKPELTSNELSQLQIRMLQSNRLPKLLPFSLQDQDMQVKLIYEISNKRMLSHAVKSGFFSTEQFYQVILGVLTALEDSKTFMLK